MGVEFSRPFGRFFGDGAIGNDGMNLGFAHSIDFVHALQVCEFELGDATEGRPWDLVTNPVAYDNGSVDFRSLRGNYYDLFAASGVQLQDSQVPVERARFWPALHVPSASSTPFNPAQKPIKTYFMGTVGTHHWGLAFPKAFSTQGMDGNPYPRTTLLKAMATFVAQVERND